MQGVEATSKSDAVCKAEQDMQSFGHENWTSLGMKVTGWMVQNLESWKVAKAAGCDSTTSDHPMALLKAIKDSCAK